MASQSKGGQEPKKQKPPNATNTDSHATTKFLVCCSIAIIFQKWFVEI